LSRTDSENRDKTDWKESPYLIIKGFLMGSADIVPGVSGGTLALITGIYHRLIYAIKSVDSKVVKHLFKLRFNKVFEYFHWKFLLLLFTGIILAIIFFTRIVPLQVYMFTHPELVYGLFFGLILGSVFLLIAELDREARNIKALLPLLIGSAIGFWVVTLVPAETPETFWYVLVSGAIAICAMILPGISGSYILLIFRKYDYILSQLGAIGSAETVQALLNLLPFVIGAATGLILFSRALSWLLNRYYSITLLILIGFLIGSLYVIWPYQDREYEESVRSTEVLPQDHQLVTELKERAGIPNQPEYQRLGDEIEAENGELMIEVESVSRKLISSKPYFPANENYETRREVNLTEGMVGIGLGFVLIIGIAILRKRSPNR
jgi:putative membrane protein